MTTLQADNTHHSQLRLQWQTKIDETDLVLYEAIPGPTVIKSKDSPIHSNSVDDRISTPEHGI